MGSLTIDLFEPGMSPLHRAGLGGLACTLKQLRWAKEEWSIMDGRTLTLAWPDDEGAGAFLERLYSKAFDLDEGMIHLPGAYAGDKPWLKAELQRGMSRTILQFGPNRKARSKTFKVVTYELDGKPLTVEHQDLVDYTHRSAWKDFFDAKGNLKPFVPIAGTIAPGFVNRHEAHKATTSINQPPGLALALHFALVGTLSIPIGGGKGVLIVPDVQNLDEFVGRRRVLNPKEPFDFQVVNPADAALQAQVRLRAAEAGQQAKVDRCFAYLFSGTMWNPNQKTRLKALEVDPRENELDLFQFAMAVLKPRLVQAKPEKKGAPPRSFWAGGEVRALIAENLAKHRPWFENFRSLVVGSDGRTDEQKARYLSFEREGLHAMIEKPWEDRGEETLVRAIHEAIRQCLGRIGEGANNDATTFQNRFDRQMERWRLAFAHAKTPDDVRGALSDIWGKAKLVPLLQESWNALLPILCDERRWQLNRDLALLALSSYKSQKKAVADSAATGPTDSSDNQS